MERLVNRVISGTYLYYIRVLRPTTDVHKVPFLKSVIYVSLLSKSNITNIFIAKEPLDKQYFLPFGSLSILLCDLKEEENFTDVAFLFELDN